MCQLFFAWACGFAAANLFQLCYCSMFGYAVSGAVSPILGILSVGEVFRHGCDAGSYACTGHSVLYSVSPVFAIDSAYHGGNHGIQNSL